MAARTRVPNVIALAASESLHHGEGKTVKLPDVALIANLCEVAWIKDRKGRFVAVNGAFASEFRVVRNEVVGKTDFYIFPVRLAERLLDNDLEVMRVGRPLRIEDFFCRNGANRKTEALKSPIFDATGKILGTLTVLRELGGRQHEEQPGREFPFT